MTTDATILAVALTVFLLLLAGVVAAVETVVTRLNVVRALRLREEHEEAPARAEALLWLTERRARSLDALLVLTVTARVALATVTAVAAYGATGRVEIVVPVALVTVFVSLVLSEVVPRTLVLRHLEGPGSCSRVRGAWSCGRPARWHSGSSPSAVHWSPDGTRSPARTPATTSCGRSPRSPRNRTASSSPRSEP